MKTILIILALTVSTDYFSQVIRLRANYSEVNIQGEKQVEKSKILITLDTANLSLIIYDFHTEKYDLYEDFDFGGGVHMYPGLDKDGNEWAIEYYPGEEWIYLTIQSAIENKNGTFNSTRYACKRL